VFITLTPLETESLFQVVLCAKPASGEWAGALQEHGKQVVRTGKGGFALRERGWWQRASLATRPLKADVACWVHRVRQKSPETAKRALKQTTEPRQ
jgi:hypothetical protein